MHTVSRRGALLSAVLLASPLPALAALPSPPRQDVELADLRGRIRAYWEAIEEEIALEGDPRYEAACERADALHADLVAVSDALVARPVKSWADVHKLAELVAMDHRNRVDELLTSYDAAEQRLGYLLKGVLEMGARHG